MSVRIHSVASCLMLGAIIVATLPSCGGKKDDAAKEAVDERPNVEILQVHEQSVSQLVSYTATVEAYKTNNITTSTPTSSY